MWYIYIYVYIDLASMVSRVGAEPNVYADPRYTTFTEEPRSRKDVWGISSCLERSSCLDYYRNVGAGIRYYYY